MFAEKIVGLASLVEVGTFLRFLGNNCEERGDIYSITYYIIAYKFGVNQIVYNNSFIVIFIYTNR